MQTNPFRLEYWKRSEPAGSTSVELPLRAELFSIEQLRRHAEELAANHQSDLHYASNRLLTRLGENEQIIKAFNQATLSVTKTRRITPATEWLLDNFYLIEEQIQLARRHLPRGYSRELPRLVVGASKGLPRVYDIVLELITHVDAQIEAEPLQAFLEAYQKVSQLKLGELWAVPIMVRLGLIENLQRVTSRLALGRRDRDLADFWVDRLQKVAEDSPSDLVIVVADMAKSRLPLTSSFVAEFCERLSRQNPVLHLARTWLEQRLSEQGQSIEQLVHLESQNQAADQISVSHSIGSLRFLSAMDWKEFVEGLSIVDHILGTDPAGVYRQMNFATRDRYRHAIEASAKQSDFTESEVAQKAIELAQGNSRKDPGGRMAHVGYYLIEKGQAALNREIKVRWPWSTLFERGVRRFPMAFFGGGIAFFSVLGTAGFLKSASAFPVPAWKLIIFGFIALLCVSQLAVSVMNLLSTLLIGPRLLPRMDFDKGIPGDQRTMVVVPTMLSSLEGIDRLIERLEIHYLANRDPCLHFALLTDFPDGPEEVMSSDRALLKRVKDRINRLNENYGSSGRRVFFLFHRPRRWNAGENVWMGYERKRGKLVEFNAVLRGRGKSFFSEIVGDTSILPQIKYVITLDTDTQLPRETARQLVATMAHPLNRPEFDPIRGIVVDGYSILQPRLGVSLPSAGRSWFARLFAGDAGIDPYTRAVSDVYQDLFQEGSFIGKGIYDVDGFERALAGRCPENTVLSHDLLESCHARSALVSDLEFYEEHPSRYNVDVERRHRWIRGDWQIVPWLLPRVPGSDANWITNPLSALSQWKILDNLRRSLVPSGLMLTLVGTWILLPEIGGIGTALVLAIIIVPSVLSLLVELCRRPSDLPISSHLKEVRHSAGRQLGLIVVSVAFLAYDAFVSLDAIVRTLHRLLITRKRLLEWQTYSESERTTRSDLGSFCASMWIAPVISVLVSFYLIWRQSSILPQALPIVGLWFLSPLVAWWMSQPIESPAVNLSKSQLGFLRRMSRKTWHFFETFVTAEENWLPPDNFQEEPERGIATRTSPTNIGLALLANIAAHDFGYLTTGQVIRRTQDTLATMRKLEKYRGHFYNWYETRTLEPLPPRYISSVDSGNLAGHLLILSSALKELAEEKTYSEQGLAGLRDTYGVLNEMSGGRLELVELDEAPANLPEALALLDRIMTRSGEIGASLEGKRNELRAWAQILERDCQERIREILHLAPWLALEPAPASWREGREGRLREAMNKLEQPITLRQTAELERAMAPLIVEAIRDCSVKPEPIQKKERAWFASLSRVLYEGSERARQRLGDLEELARQSEEFAKMDFSFLYDPSRDLFAIGFNVTEARRDSSYYDLLASEARLCGYVAIAQGQVPQNHWFSMSRLLVASQGEPILVSWSGSMFEYLMPPLVMPSYENTLLDQTCHGAVRQQIAYGALRGVPWGISESGYNRTDAQLNYQYRAFGVPGLGLRRGLAEDLVIAPYASAMALMVAPKEATDNLQRLAAEGRMGAYGFYEAVDYTPSRLPPRESSVTIRSFMAHHQGMSFLALDYLLLEHPMQRRFLACPALKAAELLLHERVPKTAANVLSEDLESNEARILSRDEQAIMRVITNPNGRAPEAHLLSNGRYHVAISGAGGGYTRWRDLAITRWREDSTRDCWGTFIYVRDTATGEFWSSAHQPSLRTTKQYEAIFTQGRAEFRHRTAGLDVHTEICVSPEDDVELRRIRLTNHSPKTRVIELTSYAEVVLAPAGADLAHPAFSNLFVQTEFSPSSRAILCTRRARSEEEKPPWLLHLMSGQGGNQGEISCETDRSRFLGRGGTVNRPAAMQTVSPLSNTVGSVLDPIISLRRNIVLAPSESATIDLCFGVSENRENALALVDKYLNPRLADRAFDLAWTHSQVILRHINATEADAQLYGRLASALIYADPLRRANSSVLLKNRRGQNGLWSYGISGDAPVVLLRISDGEKIEIVRQLIQAHSYWRIKGLQVELVILNEDVSVYRQSLQDQITSLIASGIEAQMMDKPGGIFVRRLEQIPDDDRVLLQSVARIILDDERGNLAQQLEQRGIQETSAPPFAPIRGAFPAEVQALAPRELIFNNGLGGFTRDGHEYVITLQPGKVTPAPWVNVLANPAFGTVVSESGGGYTWAENAHEFRLTPWNNDPIQDTSGEAFYIRDEQSGQFWSPTPLPARGANPYVIRHGFGYSIFEHTELGISSELSIYVAMDAPVKFAVLKLRNLSGRPRRLSATGYWEWVLGELRGKNLLHVQTEVDLKTGAVLARNPYNTEFPDRTVFLDVNETARTLTGDRKEFIGRNGTLAQPAALRRARLSGKVGAGLDPCGALQVAFDLSNGQEREICFRLGVGRNLGEVQSLVQRFRRADASRGALEGVWAFWNRTLGAVNVDTPDAAVNVLANGWLLYQTLSCRVWGRTGFYQSGGAYGFRDQLQDVMALVHAEPGITREHLLRAAAHQFKEGDVQHWWHPPLGRGVRTHFSDDYLWLPYAVCRYVTCLGDTGVLDEKISFLEARAVKPEEEAYYDLPNHSEESGPLYDHCVRAIERGLKTGAHGLPLIGCGDWNDGMNMIGKEGKGESVWLAFFLYDVLTRFAELARGRGDSAFAERCVEHARELQQNIEQNAWDGEWYRRAYFDDGEPLGSKTNPECQIDSLPQSWSVISGAGDAQRARTSMRAVDARLVRRDAGLIQLFDPPFDKSNLNPGYIKGYIPGVRENGGQYTHGALWSVMAFALLGEKDRAWELFGLLNPVAHGSTPKGIEIYKVEPYVAPADVYALAPHTGRGGWTWYTGSAGWMYRLLIETLLGLQLEGEQLRLSPLLPKNWTGFKIHYRHRQTVYHITISVAEKSSSPALLTLDGKALVDSAVPLVNDGREHFAELRIPGEHPPSERKPEAG